MSNESVVFRDGICPRCGEMCGNGGEGDTFRCLNCWWTGKLDADDEAAIQKLIRRHEERNKEESNHE